MPSQLGRIISDGAYKQKGPFHTVPYSNSDFSQEILRLLPYCMEFLFQECIVTVIDIFFYLMRGT